MKTHFVFFILICFIFYSEDFSGCKSYDKKDALQAALYSEMHDDINPFVCIDIFSNGKNQKSSIRIIGEGNEMFMNSTLLIAGYRESVDYNYSDVLFLYAYLDGKLIGAYTIGNGGHDIESAKYPEHDDLIKDIREPIRAALSLGSDNGLDLLSALSKSKSTATVEFIVKDYKNTIILKHSIKCLGIQTAIKKSTLLSGNDYWQNNLILSK